MVLTSFLYRFDQLPNGDLAFVFYLLAAGVAYVVGNVLQDVFSIFRFVTTAPVLKPGRVVKWIYRRFYGETWEETINYDPAVSQRAVRSLRRKDNAYAARYERVISGLILAATMAPCTLISSLLIWSQWWGCRNQFDFWLATTLLFLSAGLFVLARLRAARMGRIDARAPEDDRDTPEPSAVAGSPQGD